MEKINMRETDEKEEFGIDLFWNYFWNVLEEKK
jgi:hypothetical protein